MSSIGSVKTTSVLRTIFAGFKDLFSTNTLDETGRLADEVAEIKGKQTPGFIEGLETNMGNIGNEKSKQAKRGPAEKVNLTGRSNLDKEESNNLRKKENKEKEI